MNDQMTRDAFETFGVYNCARGEKSLRRWIRLYQQRVSGYWVGIDETGAWVADTSEGITPAISPSGLSAFLALLEIPQPKLHSELLARLESKMLPTQAVYSFPWIALAALGLQSGSYWASKALNWLDIIGFDERISTQLRLIADNKKISQQVRQHAFRLLRSIQE